MTGSRLLYPGILVASLGVSAVLLLLHPSGPVDQAETTRSIHDPLPPLPVPSNSPAQDPISSAPKATPLSIKSPSAATGCPADMRLVEGVYCPYVGHRCTEFIDEEKDVCKTYAPKVVCEGRRVNKRYCIDTYEYPNIEGVYPAIMGDFDDAKSACGVEGKRLCTTDEWTFACEGPAMLPYPYGLTRDPEACNIDRPYTLPDLWAFSDPWKVSGEIERLDQRRRSGEMARCVSPFGVHDMTGNVDEWAFNPQGKLDDKPYRSALKGGYWGPIRGRCRPMTSSHNQWFRFYQVGFRCCADAATSTP